jgi:hypothetical protein
MTLPEDKREDDWKKALQPLRPDAIPSPALFARVSALATEAGTTANARLPKRRGSAFRLRIAAAAVAAAAVVTGAAIYGPKMALASTLRTVASNLRQAQGIHYRITFFKNGRKALSQEIWSRDNQWRVETDVGGSRLIQIKANGKFWSYDPARRTAGYQQDTGDSLFSSVEEQFRTQAVKALDDGKGEDLGMVDYHGGRLQQVAVLSPVQMMPFLAPVPGRTLFTIDRDRMLPAITEQQIREGGDWVTVVRAEIDLTGDVSPDKFTIQDKGVRFYDINAYGAHAGSRFARPLAVKKFSTRTIAVRDVQVNLDGDIFVLYTDGSTREKDRSIFYDRFTDDRGTVYTGTAGAIEPFMYHQNSQTSRGMTVGGEILKGICMIPLVPPPSGSPAPRVIDLTIGFSEQQNKKWFIGRAKFTLPIRQTKTLLPDYSADLAALSVSGGDAERYRLDREMSRRTSYLNSQDWRGMIRATDRAIGVGVTDVNTYLDRAHAFYELGKPQKARKALAAARAADETGFYADAIARWEAEI